MASEKDWSPVGVVDATGAEKKKANHASADGGQPTSQYKARKPRDPNCRSGRTERGKRKSESAKNDSGRRLGGGGEMNFRSWPRKPLHACWSEKKNG